jgi:hypothetical protein
MVRYIGGVAMPRRKQREEFAPIGEKDIWHPYELQSLPMRKFVQIIDRILRRDYVMLDTTHCARTIEV